MSCKEYTNAIAYYRVSTTKQGQSGLGLESQQESVSSYAAANCLTIQNSFTEVETGTSKRKRTEIYKAIKAAKKQKAVLLIAKLDRLARNVHFISGLMESGVKFAAVDMPEVDNLTIHILAAVAEKEAQLISERTKAALKAVKARGVKLGKPENMTHDAQLKGAATMRKQAITSYKSTAFTANLLRSQGASYQAIANQLNDNGYTTRTGKPFQAMTVKRILDRQPA